MKRIVMGFGLLLMGVGAMAQGGAAARFHITGELKNLQATRVYLIYIEDNRQVMDSATVVNASYAFTGEIGEGGPAELLDVAPRNRPASRDIARFYLAPESYSIHQTDSFSNAVVTGSIANADYLTITAAEKPYEEREKAMLPAYQAAREAKDEATARSIEAQAKVIDKALDDSVYAVFVRRHPRSPLALYVLRRYEKNEPDAAALPGLFASLSPTVKHSATGKAFAEKLATNAKTSVGAMAMDFTQDDTAGISVSLQSFRGRYVLVDFWASWCGPCRAENPNVVNAYAKYHSKGFDIIGVSLDRPGDKDKWLKAIHADNLYWTQVSDLQFWKNTVAVEYGVEAIPQNFLIDPHGKIIAKGLRGSDLDEKLGGIFGGAGSSAAGASSRVGTAPQVLPLDPAGPTSEKLHQIDLDKAFAMYKHSFADASDQTFTFVGSFDPATIRPLLEKYLGSLPATHAGEQAKDLGIHIPAGQMMRIVYKGTEPKATVYLVFSGAFGYNPENRVRFDALKEALQIRLIQRLREDESGVYSPAVRVNMGKLPESRYSFIITFGCAPENADKLVASALDEVAKLRTAGPLQENVDKWRAEDMATRETQLKTNGWWMGYLNTQLENGEDLHQLDRYSSIADAVTPAELKAAAVKYLSGDNYIRLELLPAAK